MKQYPPFMRNEKNRIDEGSPDSGVEGYVYDGVEGSQVIHWTCSKAGVSEEHVHPFDEYFVVIDGCYTVIIKGERFPVKAGEEFFIEKGIAHSGEYDAGTRTIHFFGAKRAKRKTI